MSKQHKPLIPPSFLLSYLWAIRSKIPSHWLERPTRKGIGWRWVDPDNPNTSVRIDAGRSDVSQPSQQVHHVVVNDNGRIIGRDGQPLAVAIREAFEQAHIPLDEWLTWRSWFEP